MGASSTAAFVPCQLASQRAAPVLKAPLVAETSTTRRASGSQRCRLAPLLAGLAAAGASAAALGRRGRRAARRAAAKEEALALEEEEELALEEADEEPDPTATFRTSLGDFRVEIFLKEMPVTASNFIDLIARGFYDGMHFHRVVPGFICQFGCPNSKDPHSPVAGRSGPKRGTEFRIYDGSRRRCIRHGGHIPDEFDAKLSNVPGTISMANMGMPDTGGSQFFINMNDNSYLDWFDDRAKAKHPVFGKVIEGFDVVLKISSREHDERGCPVEPVKVFSVNMDS